MSPSIAELLKSLGYATAQIGKNHLGDRNEYLPTVHGFDEFYGILYHLNAMEEPYEDDFPKGDDFYAKFGPRNIIDTKATTRDDSTTDPRWGRVGKQTIADGGPLPPGPNMDPKAKVDMTNVDEELVRRSNDFMERSVKAGKPFFLWHNSTRTHVWTHLAPKWQGKSGFGLYADAMMELDHLVGYNFMPYFEGKVEKGPRNDFFYWSDSGDLMALRYGPWKLSFKTIQGNLFTGHEATTNVPIMTNLRTDPWERYQEESMMYGKWWGQKLWTVVPAGAVAGQYLQTFEDYPPSQVGGSFGIEQILKKVEVSLQSRTN